jgi:hypothetical protein
MEARRCRAHLGPPAEVPAIVGLAAPEGSASAPATPAAARALPTPLRGGAERPGLAGGGGASRPLSAPALSDLGSPLVPQSLPLPVFDYGRPRRLAKAKSRLVTIPNTTKKKMVEMWRAGSFSEEALSRVIRVAKTHGITKVGRRKPRLLRVRRSQVRLWRSLEPWKLGRAMRQGKRFRRPRFALMEAILARWIRARRQRGLAAGRRIVVAQAQATLSGILEKGGATDSQVEAILRGYRGRPGRRWIRRFMERHGSAP